MEVIHLHHPLSLSLTVEPSVIALGFFDGVHLGHQQLLNTAKQIAEREGLLFAVMTFYPHPREVMGVKEKIDKYLTPLHEKIHQFRSFGVKKVYVIQFNKQFGHLSPEDFVEQYIVHLGVKCVVVGFDFTFGHKGRGDVSLLERLGNGKFKVTMVQKIEYKKQKISSTLIRELIASGNVEQIPLYIGKHYEVRGFIEPKKRNEKKIVNEWLRMNVEREYLLPKPGVYIISLETEEEIYKGICCYTSGNHLFIQVQASTCEELKKEKVAKVKWIRFLSSPKLFSESSHVTITKQ